jgi:tetraacyldisaccharide-1-P 4'-kinase
MPWPFEDPSLLRKIILAPVALIYAVGSSLHRRLWLQPQLPLPRLPLIVIGSLRAGGAGKTPVTLELAKYLAAQGKRVGILVYRIRGTEDLEVTAASDWRESSDEAVLLARKTGARVFATRNRAVVWKRMDRAGEFDVLLADDGLMDTRLGDTGCGGAFRICLVRYSEHPGLLDLLPAGPYHLTVAALKSMDIVLPFSREIVLPDNFDFEKRYWVICGMGNPAAFKADLERAGVQVAGLSAGPNHGLPDPGDPAWGFGSGESSGFLFSAKDGVKLAERLRSGVLAVEIGEHVTFSTGFLSAVDAFLAPPSS